MLVAKKEGACQGNNQVKFIKSKDENQSNKFSLFFSGLYATVRKCKHRETGITYAAKFSSRVRNGISNDCSMEILHEIAMLSVCTDSNKIVNLKDVFQNKHEIILVME